jgi:serine/threonine protein kinase
VLGAGDVQITETAPFSSGSFSDIWRGSFEGRDVVVKSLRCYSSPGFDPAEVGIRFLREAWASNKLRHPNIVPFIGVLSTPNHPFALLYEKMGNADLGPYLAQYPNVSRLKHLIEISRALKYMHSQDVVHGNVRMRNVLVDDNGVSRLGGLGSALSLSLPASWSDVEPGRLHYEIAPELIHPDAFGFVHARPTEATDIFGFGMLALEVLTGKPPFGKNVQAAVILSVFQNERPSRPAHPQVSDRVWNMIQRCWNEDPFNRMTAAEVVDVLEAEL